MLLRAAAASPRSAAAASARARLLSTLAYPTGNYAAYMLKHIEASAAARPASVALINGATNEAVLYRDLPYRIGAAARGFRALGVTRGTVVALHLPNCPEFLIAFNALAALGAVVTTSNPAYSPAELTHQFRDAGAALVLTLPGPLEAAARAAAEALRLPPAAVLTLGSPATAFLTADASAAAGALRALPNIEAVDGPATLFALPYSSGTTGLPKGVALSHGNLTANLLQSSSCLPMAPSDAVLGVLPMFHIYGITCLMGLPLLQGATLVTLPKFDPQSFLAAIQRHRTSYLFVAPPIVAFLAKHPLVASFDLAHVHTIFSGAAPLDVETQVAAERRFPAAAVRQGYGMTEASPITHAERIGAKRPGSIGTPMPDTECRVMSVGGEGPPAALPPGRANVGELQVRGPQVMLGYHGNAKATAETLLPGGWLRTGDLVYQDAEGFFYVVDRIKELIKVKGLQVAPAELEGLLLQHPLVYDCAVVGRPDERAGEAPVAFVVTKAAMLRGMGNAAGAAALPELTQEALKAFLAGKVAEYKMMCVARAPQACPPLSVCRCERATHAPPPPTHTHQHVLSPLPAAAPRCTLLTPSPRTPAARSCGASSRTACWPRSERPPRVRALKERGRERARRARRHGKDNSCRAAREATFAKTTF